MLDGVNFAANYFGVLFFGAATLFGMALMFAGGAYFATVVLDWLIERILRSLELYREFLAFARPRVMSRAKKRLTKTGQK